MEGRGVKILPRKQILQILPILLAQVEKGNTSLNLFNETNCLLIVSNKVNYKNGIQYSIQSNIKISKIFIISNNSKTSDVYMPTHKNTYNINLQRRANCLALSNLSIYYAWKNIRRSYRNK